MAQNTESGDPIESLSNQLTGWTHQFIDTFSSRTVRPLMIGVRGITVGLFITTVALAALVAGSIGLARLFNVSVFHGRVWATDLLFGVIFLIIGLFLVRRANPKGGSGERH
ncbi:MAG TPA: hypothetical protein VMU99_02675 [Acidimicrobiales bacterium]|nr:hypothetical protein [Acidimicrobiales bacterium]